MSNRYSQLRDRIKDANSITQVKGFALAILTMLEESVVVLDSESDRVASAATKHFDANDSNRRHEVIFDLPTECKSGASRNVDAWAVASEALGTRVHNACMAANHPGVYVHYSAYSTDDNDVPVDNLDTIAHRGTYIISHNEYVSEVVVDPTWLELAVHANAALIANKEEDGDHIYFEGVEVEGGFSDSGSFSALRMYFGS